LLYEFCDASSVFTAGVQAQVRNANSVNHNSSSCAVLFVQHEPINQMKLGLLERRITVSILREKPFKEELQLAPKGKHKFLSLCQS